MYVGKQYLHFCNTKNNNYHFIFYLYSVKFVLQIISEQLNFRHLGYSASELRNEEENNRFPPRFKLNIVNTNYTPSEISLYEYHIYIKSEGESDKTLTLNICGFGHPNKGQYLNVALLSIY